MKKELVILVLVAIASFFIGAFFLSVNGRGGENIISNQDEECKWEKLYQGLYGSQSVYRDIGQELRKGGFVAPLGRSYKEVEFTEFGVIASTEESDNRFLLNGVDCGEIKRDIFGVNDFSDSCIQALKEGLNDFNSSKRDVIIHEVYIGMKYRPANCLS